MTASHPHANRQNFRLGFVLNPLAGVGGPAALKGSDAEDIQRRAEAGEFVLQAGQRATTFFQHLRDIASDIDIHTVAGPMGSDVIPKEFTIIEHHYVTGVSTRAVDTQNVVKLLQEHNLDLLVFAGGDGTARDVCQVLNPGQAALGVPAGVKMQSAVYGIHPIASAHVVSMLVKGELVGLCEREVRDLDEDAYRNGEIRSRFYGEMCVPEAVEHIQAIKQASVDVDELVLHDLAEDIAERWRDIKDRQPLLIFAPGSTVHFIEQHLGMEASLLGVDIRHPCGRVEVDVNANCLQQAIIDYKQSIPQGVIKLIVTAIGGQGHLFGRGNQQITAQVLEDIGRDNVWVVVSKTKLMNLAKKPLLIDSGSPTLDRRWAGYIPVISAYRDQVLYRLAC